MFDVDRTVIGNERRRWHPVNPFQMKRHGLSQILRPAAPVPTVFASQSRKGLTEPFACLPRVGLVFGKKPPRLAGPEREVPGTRKPYGALLLTMIKIVLIAAISFASPCQ